MKSPDIYKYLLCYCVSCGKQLIYCIYLLCNDTRTTQNSKENRVTILKLGCNNRCADLCVCVAGGANVSHRCCCVDSIIHSLSGSGGAGGGSPPPVDASDPLFVGHEADVGQIYSFNDPEQPCTLHVSLRAAPQETCEECCL